MFAETDFSRPDRFPVSPSTDFQPFWPKTGENRIISSPFRRENQERDSLFQSTLDPSRRRDFIYKSIRPSHVICTFKYFPFRPAFSFLFFSNSFQGLALLSPCELVFARAYRVSESSSLYISSWSVHRLNPRSVVYEFLTRDVTYKRPLSPPQPRCEPAGMSLFASGAFHTRGSATVLSLRIFP